MRARPLALAATGLALATVLAACGTGTTSSTMSGMGSGSPDSTESSAGHAADVAFAQLMIPHHRQAVDMADLALRYGRSPEVEQLAGQVASAQGPEIETMTGWLDAWDAPLEMDMSVAHDMGGMSASGMMSDADMAHLGRARGAGFDRMWLQMMIAHHEGAVAMARQVLATTSDPQVAELADGVVAGQTAEIETMRGLLAE